MSGSRSMAGANVLLLRKAEDKRQRDALRRAFKVGICSFGPFFRHLLAFFRKQMLIKTRDCHLVNTAAL